MRGIVQHGNLTDYKQRLRPEYMGWKKAVAPHRSLTHYLATDGNFQEGASNTPHLSKQRQNRTSSLHNALAPASDAEHPYTPTLNLWQTRVF